MFTNEEKKNLCLKFFADLAEGLKDRYEIVESCNEDESKYLIPKGTIEDLSYYGKPMWSFRISDHWNWYSNVRKCKYWNVVQCLTDNLPSAHERIDARATKPIFGWMVAIYKNDQKYHVIFGDEFDCEDRKWYWNTSDVQDIIDLVLSGSPGAIGGES